MPDSLRDILLAASVPAFSVDGADRPELARDLLALELEETIEGMASLSMTLSAIGPRPDATDEALLWLDGRVLDFGREIAVSLGPAGAQERVFTGRISAIELDMAQGREPEVRVLAEDRLMDLRMTRRFATWEEADLAAIARGIAARHGLSAEVDVDDAPAQPMVQQWNQTDLGFLREQAARIGAELWLEGTVLHVAARERRDTAPSLTLIQGNDLLSVSLRADLSGQRSRVTVGGYDAAAKQGIAESAESGLATAEAEGRRAGPAVLEAAFGARDTFRLRDVPLASAAATAWARAAMLVRARRFVQAEGVTTGTPALRPGARLNLERVGDVFSGDGYRVTRSLHRYDLAQGYRTLFSAERAGLGSAAA